MNLIDVSWLSEDTSKSAINSLCDEFIRTLDPDDSIYGEAIQVHCFPDKDEGEPKRPEPLYKEFPLYHKLKSLNSQQLGVFFTVLPQADLYVRSKYAYTKLPFIFLDFDGNYSSKVAQDLDLRAIVRTSNDLNRHCYIAIHPDDYDPANADKWLRASTAIATYYQSDVKVSKDFGRVLRLPGFYHQKREPVLVEMVHGNKDSKQYRLDELLAMFPYVNEEKAPKPSAKAMANRVKTNLELDFDSVSLDEAKSRQLALFSKFNQSDRLDFNWCKAYLYEHLGFYQKVGANDPDYYNFFSGKIYHVVSNYARLFDPYYLYLYIEHLINHNLNVRANWFNDKRFHLLRIITNHYEH